MKKILFLCAFFLLAHSFCYANDFILGHIEPPNTFPENVAKHRLKTAENLKFNKLYVEQLPIFVNPSSIQISPQVSLGVLPLYKCFAKESLFQLGDDSPVLKASSFTTPFIADVSLLYTPQAATSPFSAEMSAAFEKQFAFVFQRQIEGLFSLQNCRGIILNSQLAPLRPNDVNLFFDAEYRMKPLMKAEVFKSIFAPCVTIAHLSKHNCFSNEELDISLLARSTQKDLNHVAIKWELRNPKDLILKEGTTSFFDLKKEIVLTQNLNLKLEGLPSLTPLTFRTYLRSASNHALTEVATQSLMIYPPLDGVPMLDLKWADSVVITDSLPVALEAIRAQKRLLLLAKTLGNETSHVFPLSSFESALLFQKNHPLFAPLACQEYVDYYWEKIGEKVTLFDVTDLNLKKIPLVLHSPFLTSHAYSPLFELSVDSAKMLVCGFDLNSDRAQNLEKMYLQKALYDYLISENFKPADTAPIQWIEKSFTQLDKKSPKQHLIPTSYKAPKK